SANATSSPASVWIAAAGPLGSGPTGGALARLDPARAAEPTHAETARQTIVLPVRCIPLSFFVWRYVGERPARRGNRRPRRPASPTTETTVCARCGQPVEGNASRRCR